MPDRAIDENSVARLGIDGDFTGQRLVALVGGRQGFTQVRLGYDAGGTTLLAHFVEHNDRVDGQRAIAGKDKIAMPGAFGAFAVRSLPQEIVLQQLHLMTKDGLLAG